MTSKCLSCKHKNVKTRYGYTVCNYSGSECRNFELYDPMKQTNADRIRAMTDEELAMLLGAPTIVFQPWCDMDYDCPYIDQDPARCDLCALDWLKREVSDGT